MLQAVIFDFDGVIADSEPLHLRAYQQVLGAETIELSHDDYYSKYLGFDDVGVFRTIMADHGRPLDERRLHELIANKGHAYEALVETTDVIFPHAADCVRRLAEAVPLAIASGALHAEIDGILRRANLHDCFRAIVGADDTARSKPAPDPYLEAVRRLQAWLPERKAPTGPGLVVAIEDSVWGLESARAAGLRTVAVTTTYPAETVACADLVVSDLSQISAAVLARLGEAG